MIKKKILFVIYSIHGGGAEKQMQYILKNIDLNNFEPHLCIFSRNENAADILPNTVHFHNLGTHLRPSSVFLVFKLTGLLKSLKPFKALSFTWGINLITLFAGILSGTPVVISERIDTISSIKSYSMPWLRNLLVSFLYRYAAKITTVTNSIKNNLISHFKIPENKIETIYNAINLKDTENKSNEYPVDIRNYVLACGSLEKKKNFDFLLDIFANVPDHTLVILGKGRLKYHLISKAEKLGIKLVLPGYKENPYPYFKRAKAFVLTSEYEGMPNVLLEAMACKTPILAVNCPGGINEIIDDNNTGILLNNMDMDIARNTVNKLLNDTDLRNRLIENAYNKVKQHFTLENMLKKYENILDS